MLSSTQEKRASAIIIQALGDNPSTAIEDSETSKNAWQKHQDRYDGKTIMNKLGVLNILLKSTQRRGEDIGNYVENLESYVLRQSKTGSDTEEQMRNANLLFSTSVIMGYASTSTSINILQEGEMTWYYGTTTLSEEYKRLTRTKDASSEPQEMDHRTLAAIHGSRDVGIKTQSKNGQAPISC